mgnify:CR=1 FL=1|jgi:metal-responsive CopG/Arc/MetJ family transcriptional regulator
MAKPTTIRISEDLLNEINEIVQELKLDRSAYLREVLRKSLKISIASSKGFAMKSQTSH